MHNFLSWAQREPDKVVLIQAETGESFTARRIAERALRLAQWLAGQGLKEQDTIAILLENRVEIVELVLAAREAGLYAAVISTHLTPAEVQYIVQDSGAQRLFVSSSTWANAEAAHQALGLPCFSVDGDTPGVRSIDELLDAAASLPATDLSTRALGRDLLYSSGTTGRPKGVRKPLFGAQFRQQTDPEVANTQRLMQFGEQTVYLSPAPLYHAAPLRYTLRALDSGGRAVIMRQFNAEFSLACIERFGVTHSQWVPTMMSRMLKLPDAVRQRFDLSTHRVAIHAAAPCPVPLKLAMLDWWGDILMEYYAGSEGCGTTLIDSAEWRRKPGSVGRAFAGVLHIVDDDGKELGANEVGRIYFEKGGEFSYLNDAAKTREAMNEHGWATYGDIGYVDEDGYLFLSDRRADLILSGGVNVYPQEIENALVAHAAVDEVAVVGVPHEDFGEQPIAVVVLKPGEMPSEELAHAIAAQAASHLSKVKWPRRLVFETRLPRLETGKLLRRVLKERFRGDPDAGYDVRAALASGVEAGASSRH
ncbi:AMP-binding protein [Diaphorobacter aerolatus]|uniref:AMP-binding protein n=1 Tax=Diaphorobacter aerolatus TaxID=1288495 RepID=A0A7H0GPR6_9BURK|nr:AMP-binding protein [Diaphorobacter aerolatus]QNP50282.1 AMP-binding protein [Diaphorobacter aerolatus]